MVWSAAALALLALVLRLPTLASRSLWFDELHTWSDAYWLPPEGRTHWLFFRIVSVFTEVFGRNEWGLRLYPMLAGVAGVFLITLWVWRLGGRLPALLAGFALAVSPTHVAFSQEGRYYAPMVLFAVGALWCATEFFLSRDRRRWLWLALTAASCWLGWTNHITSAVLAGVITLWIVVCLVGSPWGRRLAARIAIGAKPASRARIIFIGLTLVIIAGLATWKGGKFFFSHMEKISFERRTPNVEFTWSFLLWNLGHFGAGATMSSALGKLAWAVYEIGFLAGLVWLFWKRTVWAVLVVAGLAMTAFAVFGYPVTQPYAPKYVAFLYPLRILCFAAGWAAIAGWISGRIPRLQPARSETIAAVAVGLVLLALAVLPLVTHYTTSRTPIRKALEWILEHGSPEAPIAAYGHTTYDVEYYARRLDMKLGRFVILEWPSESGRVDMGEIRAAVPESGELYFIYGWPHDIPPKLTEGLETEFDEVARFPSSESRIYDSVVYQWKYKNATLRESRTLEWSLTAGALDRPTPFYCLFGIGSEWTIHSEAAGEFRIDGEAVSLSRSDGATSQSARLFLEPGEHEWVWIPADSQPAAVTVRCAPGGPLRLSIPGVAVTRRGQRGEMADTEFQGREPLHILKNNWVQYDLSLDPGRVYSVSLVGYNSPDGPAYLEVRLDGDFAGVVGYFRGDGRWGRSTFAFRARKQSTAIRVRLISEFADGAGGFDPGVGLAIDALELEEIPDDGVRLADNRIPIEQVVMHLPPETPAYTVRGSDYTVAPSWTGIPDIIETRIVDGGDNGSLGGPRLQLHFKPPYDGSVMSPYFPVTPGKVIYLALPVEVDEVYNIGATVFLMIGDANDGGYPVFSSEGGIEDRIDWDYVSRTFERTNRKRFTFFATIPEDVTKAAVGVMIWPHTVPLRAPRMTITLDPPIAPQKNPDLLSR